MRVLRRNAAGRHYLLRSSVALFALSSATQVLAADPAAPTATAAPAPAADATTAPPEGASNGQDLGVITVTAQRRSENLQRVPIAINVVSGEQMENRGADSINNLAAVVPNLNVTGSFNSNIYVRGVGANNASSNNEPSVAVYVDGVYMPSNVGLRAFPFNHIQRLEVLKGPQGTLFGRNATAGVIQFITPDPKHEFSGDVSAGYGNYDTLDATAYVTGGLTPIVAADLAIQVEDQRGNWGYNYNFNTPIFHHKNAAIRSKWLLTPSPSTRITVAVDYSRYRSDGGNNYLVPGSIGIDKFTTNRGHFVASGVPNISDNNQYGAMMRIDQDLGDVLHLASISSYRKVWGHWRVDNDLGPLPLVQVDNYNTGDYFTEELQLSNRNPGRISWIAGAFLYGNEVYGSDPQLNTGTNTAQGYRAMYGVQQTHSYSAFGQATAELVAGTKLTLGLRYTDETLKTQGRTLGPTGAIVAGPFKGSIHFNPWTWRVALDHQFGPDVLGYVSYNRGFKSGGYNLSTPGGAPFFPETLDAYEAGIKSQFLDRRVRLNIGAFYYNYRNLQVAIVPGGGSQIFTNAAKARNYGLDATLEVAATRNLRLSAGLGLLNAKYLDYANAQGFTILGVPFPIANAKGATLPYAPRVSANFNIDYHVPLATGELTATAGAAYTSKTFITPDMGLTRPAYTLVSATLEWKSHAGWGVRLWGKNLLNEYYYANGTESRNGWYISPGAPRTYGATLLAEW